VQQRPGSSSVRFVAMVRETYDHSRGACASPLRLGARGRWWIASAMPKREGALTHKRVYAWYEIIVYHCANTHGGHSTRAVTMAAWRWRKAAVAGARTA